MELNLVLIITNKCCNKNWCYGAYGVYTGLDCVYSGAGRTNSSAIVGGEIARAAANAVVGAVSQRLSAAMNMNSDTAAHMSYSSNGNGIGMAANHIVGGLSIWTNFSSSNFENDQTFTSVRDLTVIIMMEMHLL